MCTARNYYYRRPNFFNIEKFLHFLEMCGTLYIETGTATEAATLNVYVTCTSYEVGRHYCE